MSFTKTLRCSLWLTILMAVIVLVAFLNLEPEPTYDVCETEACVKVADTIRLTMDPSVDPCVDFYQFACGGYIKRSVLPKNKASVSLSSEWDSEISKVLYQELESQTLEGQPPVFQKAKDLYKSCLDTDSIEKKGLKDLKDGLRYYGGWPVLEDQWDEKAFNWIETTRKLADVGQPFNLIIAVSVGPNIKNVSQTVVQISQPSLGKGVGITRRSLIKGMHDPVVRAYYETMVDTAVEFGADRVEAEIQLRESLQFEMDLANISVPEEDLRDVPRVVEILTVTELQESYPQINWLNLFNAIAGDIVVVYETDTVNLFSPLFLSRVGSFMDKTPKRVLANYMMWQVVFANRMNLSRRVQKVGLKLQKVLYGTGAPRSRRHFCFKTTRALLSPMLSAVYIRKHFTPNVKQKAMHFAELFQKQLLNLLEEVDWLDPVTRKRALRKVKLLKLDVGYPDELANDEYLNKYYKRLSINRSDFLRNVLSVSRFSRLVEIHRLHKPFNVTAWDCQSLASVIQYNAFNNLNANSVALYSGLLHGYSFDADRPLFLNIATVGTVIGHELSHSVDDLGADFDELGNLHDWWEAHTKQTFSAKANAVSGIFSTYVLKSVNLTINAKKMLGEIIADEAGVKIAYRVLEDTLSSLAKETRLVGLEAYSARQMFWIAQSVAFCAKVRPVVLKREVKESFHPPHEFRINGPLRNSLQFSQVWKCPLGIYMNPERKVNVW